MKKLPDTSQAEKWIDADTFVKNGHRYRIAPDGTVKEIGKEDKNDHCGAKANR
jgi:hypothetical protein